MTSPIIMNHLTINFLSPRANFRRLRGGGYQQLLARACLAKTRPRVIDATAGLGRDAFVLACLGCDVTMIERCDSVANALADALVRLQQQAPELASTLTLNLIHQDAKVYLSQLSESEFPDVIYCDPMYPPRKKSALVKKEMRMLRNIVGDDEDFDDLFNIACQCAKKRVVVKRPRLATGLAKADVTYKGRSSRYDVYSSANCLSILANSSKITCDGG